jgi:hypothetical protein
VKDSLFHIEHNNHNWVVVANDYSLAIQQIKDYELLRDEDYWNKHEFTLIDRQDSSDVLQIN